MCANFVDMPVDYIHNILSSSYANHQMLKNTAGHVKQLELYQANIKSNQQKIDQLQAILGQKSTKSNAIIEYNRLKKKNSKIIARAKSLEKTTKASQEVLVNKYITCQNILSQLKFIDLDIKTDANDDIIRNADLTIKGEFLRQLYCENVLIVILLITQETFSTITPNDLLAILSTFISVSRGSQETNHHLIIRRNSHLPQSIKDLVDEVVRQTEIVHELEIRYKNYNESEIVNYGLLYPAHLLSLGADIEHIMAQCRDLVIGDFIRCISSIYDLLNQIIRIVEDLQFKGLLVGENEHLSTQLLENLFKAREIIKNHEIYSLLYL